MKKDLLDLIDEKLKEAKNEEAKGSKPKPKPRTRQPRAVRPGTSTGPRTPEGKARSSENSLRHGFYATVDHLHPNDSPLYNQTLDDLREGLHPDGPAEEHLIRDLAMLSARIKRLEAMEYALAMANIEAPPKLIKDPYDDVTPPTPQIDARDLTESYLKSLDQIERLSKIETHLRRAYNRTWERLERMQRERHKLPLDQMLKQTQVWATYEALRTNQPERVPARDPRIDEKGKFHKPERQEKSDRPNEDKSKDEIDE